MCNQVKSYTKHGRLNQSQQKLTVALMGVLHPNQKLTCFVLYLEIINIFLKIICIFK